MKHSIFFLAATLLFLFCSCKKNTNEPKEEPDHFSFVYNGATYNYSITNNASSGGVLQNADNTLGIFIDMPAVFGGRITFSHPTCAYMEPLDTAIYDDGSCHLST